MWIVTRDGVNVAGTRDAGLLVHLEAELQAAGLAAVAIEVDGPQHYASNCAAPLGRTLVRDRLLQARGWQVWAGIITHLCRMLHFLSTSGAADAIANVKCMA